MVQYLTKEEVRQWRSSLEKVTLEEFARRLGKEIEENKRTHDIVDMIVNNESVSSTEDIVKTKAETKPKQEQKSEQKPEEKTETPVQKKSNQIEFAIAFSKSLTEREKRVFEYLSDNKGKSVKAQDLASVLDIPRDYIYKYIRNLRKKMQEDLLVNSDEGGFILNI